MVVVKATITPATQNSTTTNIQDTQCRVSFSAGIYSRLVSQARNPPARRINPLIERITTSHRVKSAHSQCSTTSISARNVSAVIG